MSEATYNGDKEGGEPSAPSGNGQQGGGGGGSHGLGPLTVDTTYARSIEGILKMITVACAVVGMILVFIAWVSGAGGWFIFVGFWYIVYVIIVFVVEMCLPGIYVHRLIDGIIVLAYAALWAFAAIINLAFGVMNRNVTLGLSVIFCVACSGLCVAQAIFAFHTWRTFEEGRKGSRALFVI